MSAFGCKPSRYPCSAEALLKRVARGNELPVINRLVEPVVEMGRPPEDRPALSIHGLRDSFGTWGYEE